MWPRADWQHNRKLGTQTSKVSKLAFRPQLWHCGQPRKIAAMTCDRCGHKGDAKSSTDTTADAPTAGAKRPLALAGPWVQSNWNGTSVT